jgi:hypothetical protein
MLLKIGNLDYLKVFTEVRCNKRTSYVDIVQEKAICMAESRSTVQ